MRRLLLAALCLLWTSLLWVNPALAVINYTQGSGTVIFDFTCFTTNHCEAHVNINSAGTEIFTSGNPATVTGSGSAGTPAGGVLTVQGVASMTPVLANPGTAANWGIAAPGAATPANASLVGGSDGTDLRSLLTSNTGQLHTICDSGCSSTGGTSSNFNATFPTAGTATGGLYQAGTPSYTSGQMVPFWVTATGSQHVTQDNVNPNGQAAASASQPIVPAANWIQDQCFATNKKITQAFTNASTTPFVLITGTGTQYTYICSIVIVSATQQSFSIVEGTQTTTPCDTNTYALLGGTTASTGPAVAANGGFSLGSGIATVIGATNNSADNVCLFQSGSGVLAGTVTYVHSSL